MGIMPAGCVANRRTVRTAVRNVSDGVFRRHELAFKRRLRNRVAATLQRESRQRGIGEVHTPAAGLHGQADFLRGGQAVEDVGGQSAAFRPER